METHICQDWRCGLRHRELTRRAYLDPAMKAKIIGNFTNPDLVGDVALNVEGDTLYDAMGQSLFSSDYYFLSPTVNDLIGIAAAKIGTAGLVFTPQMMPSVDGFCSIPNPHSEITSSSYAEVRALSWTHFIDSEGLESIDEITPRIPATFQGIALGFWAIHVTYATSANLVALMPYAVFRIMFGVDATAPDPAATLISLFPGNDEQKLADASIAKIQFAYSFFHFVAQQIIEIAKAPLNRAERRRELPNEQERSGSFPSFNVVQLRKKYHEQLLKTPTPTKTIDWRNQWVVSGHWRNQWFSASKIHHLIWIDPHIKGPEDKPFKSPRPANTIFVVDR